MANSQFCLKLAILLLASITIFVQKLLNNVLLHNFFSREGDCHQRRMLKFYIRSGLDKDGFQVKYISDFKGFGVFAKEQFKKGEFLLEYFGENISPEEAAVRSKKLDCNMIFHFFHKGKQYCIDAASCVDHICQYVNDNNVKDANARMKLLDIDGRPKLCLFATKT